MPSPMSDSTSINYSRVDDTSRRLWQSQIGKANPWDHRQAPEDDEPERDEASALSSAAEELRPAAANLIGQADALNLSHHGATDAVSNPFTVLLQRVGSASPSHP